jgi:hypothetical protein
MMELEDAINQSAKIFEVLLSRCTDEVFDVIKILVAKEIERRVANDSRQEG